MSFRDREAKKVERKQAHTIVQRKDSRSFHAKSEEDIGGAEDEAEKYEALATADIE